MSPRRQAVSTSEPVLRRPGRRDPLHFRLRPDERIEVLLHAARLFEQTGHRVRTVHAAMQAQEIEARNFYRPIDPTVAAKYASRFPKLKLFSIDDTFGGWTKAQATHFADGGVFDQIYAKK